MSKESIIEKVNKLINNDNRWERHTDGMLLLKELQILVEQAVDIRLKELAKETMIQSKFISYYGFDVAGQVGQDVYLNLDKIDGFVFENGKIFPILNGKIHEYGMSLEVFNDFKDKVIIVKLKDKYNYK